MKLGDIKTCKYIRSEKESKRGKKILLKYLTSIDDINTREYIRSKPERTVRKDIKNNNNNYLRLHKQQLYSVT